MKLTNIKTTALNTKQLSRKTSPWTSLIFALLFAWSLTSNAQDVTIGSGTTITNPTGTTLNINGNLTINAGGTMANSGIIIITGNWTNNGTYSGTGSVQFTGATSTTISGSSTTALSSITINKGSSTATVLDVNGTGPVTAALCTLSNGLLRVNTGSSFAKGGGNITVFPSTFGIHVNGGTFSTVNSIQSMQGTFTVSSGSASVGTASGNNLQATGSGTISVSGGTLNVSGRLEASSANLNISGGVITLCTVGNASGSVGSLDLSATANFSMTNGTVIFQIPNSNSFRDVNIVAGGTKTITGGTLQFGNASTAAASIFKISSPISVNNITINATNNPQLTLVTALTIGATGTLTMNGGNLNPSGQVLQVNNTAASAIVRTNGFVNGQLKWQLPASVIAPGVYLFPTGKNSTYLPYTLTNPSGNSPLISMEAFDVGSGGAADLSTVFAISNTEYWLASNTGSFTGGTVTLTRPTPVTPNDRIAQAALQAGPYSSINGTPSGNSISGGTASSLGYFVMGQGCVAPSFSPCPSNTTASTALNLCTAAVSYTATVLGSPTPTVNYTFSGVTTGSGGGTGSGSVFNKGTTNVTITATNACGSATCTFTVTVNDNQAPNAICQNISVNLDATGNASITPSQVNNGSTDNCGVVNLVSVSPNTFNCSNVGVAAPVNDLIISEYVEGSSNNKYIELYNGTSGPINLGDYRLRLYANGAIATTNDVLLSGTLNAGQTIVYKNSAAVIFGGTAITNAAVNYNGDDAVALFKISTGLNVDIFGRIGEDPGTAWTVGTNTTLDKTLRRKSTVTQGITTNPGAGFPTLLSEWDQFNIDDVSGLGAHLISPPGSNSVTLTINDGNGNTSTCVANVTVADVTPPNAVCQNISVNLDATGNAVITPAQVNNGSSDACGIATTTLSQTAFNCTNIGANTVTLTVTDINGLTSTCTATVTIVDNTVPNAICQNITVNLDATGNASITPAMVNNGSNDNCGTINLVSVSPNTFNCSNISAASAANDLIISEYVEGSSSNKYMEIFNGTGTTKNLANYELRLYSNGAAAPTTTNVLTAAGSLAPGATVVLQNSAAVIYGGTSFVFSAVNWNGDDAIALFNTVSGQNADVFGRIGDDPGTAWTLGGNTTLDKTLRRKSTVVNGVTVSPSGTGAGAFLTLSAEWDQFNIDDISGLGGHLFTPPSASTPVTLTINDGHGNTSTCISNVTIVDVTPPVATCQNITVPLNANGTVTVSAAQVNNGSSDACGIATMSLSQTNFTCANVGINSVTLTVTDANGLTSTCSATITITDVTPPVANCQNITIALDATGNASITASQINNGSSDACGLNPNMTVTPNTFNCSDITGDPASDLIISEYIEGNVGSNKYIELYNGTAGSINLANYKLRLYANGAVAPTNDVALSGTLAAGQTIVYQNSSANLYTGAVTNNAAVNFNGDDAVVLFKVSTSTPVDIIGRIGEDPGTAWTSGGLTTLDATLRRKPTVIQGVSVNPASGFPTLSTEWDQFLPGDVSGLGAHLLTAGNLVTLTVTDVNGNSSNCTAYVTVQDATPPTVNCPVVGNANRNTDPGACTYTSVGTEFNATASDNCSYTLTYQLLGVTGGTGTTLTGKVFNKGVTLVKWIASDGVNAPVSCNFSVTVIDNQQPVITCPVAINADRNTNLGQCTYTVTGTEFNATSTDNCAVTSLTYTLSGVTSGTGSSLAGVTLNKGVTTVTWSASDGVNPAVTCSFTVTVIDNQQPVITCPVAINADRNTNSGQCTYTVSGTEFNATSTDNCVVTSLTYTLSGVTSGTGSSLAGVVLNKGVTTIVWSASDGVNPAVTCSFTVTVIDNQQPVITCPVAINADRNTNSGQCTYTVSGTEFNATSTDNCAVTSLTYTLSGVTSGTGSSLAGVTLNKGVTTVTWSASDGVNPAVTCSFTVTVIDNQQPVITCPVAINADRNTNSGQCTYTVSGTEFNATSTDNCAVTSLTYTLSGVTSGTGSGLAGVVLNKGVTTVTWSASDGVNPAVTCSFTVTVIDIQQPIITCPVAINANRNTNLGQCTYIVSGTEFNATSTDNCSVTSLNYTLSGVTSGTGSSLAGVTLNKGVTTVTWSASDGVNPAVTCSFTVTVSDNQQPVITCPVAVNANRNTNSGQCTYTVSGTEFNATSTDNCAVTSLTYTLSGVTSGTGSSLAGVVLNKGVTTIVWTASDGVNPSVTCSFTVTVVDAEYPVFVTPCPASFAACNAPGISWTPPTASDNCSVILTSNISPGSVFLPGTTTVIYTAVDPTGNTTTCSFDVTVKEVSQNPVSASAAPAVICSGNQTTLTVNGGYLGTGAQWKWYTGSCGGTLIGFGPSIQVNPLASTVYYVRAEGDCNTTNCVSVSVTVQTTSTDPASATSNAPANGICLGSSVTLTVNGGSLGIGATWAWYEDACGTGSFVGNGSSVTIIPALAGLHSYYVRAEGPCNTTNCVGVQVLVGTYSVEATSITSSIAGNSICTGNNITLTVNGGFLGTVAQWQWYTGSCGGTAAGTGPSIIVNPSVTTTYFARAEGSCNTTLCKSIVVNVSGSAPSNPPPTITSAPNGICSGNGSTVICQSVPGATFYSWSAPNGTTFDGNNPSPYITTTNTVQVTFGNLPNGISGYDICVFAGNGCGNTVTKCRYIRGRVQTAQTITGNASSCPNTTSAYSIVSLPGADSYTWTVTGAATINGGGTTLTTTATTVNVNFLAGWTSGTLTVYGSMNCGYNGPAKTITIISTPVVPGVITGPALVCPTQTYNYSIAPVAGAISYNWSTNVPGAIIGAGTTSRNITFPASIPPGATISVTATGSCGTSLPQVKNIATGLANSPGTITGPATGQCGNTTGYSILPVAGATSYLWTADNSATIFGFNNITTASVVFPVNSNPTTVSVIAINGCGNSAPQTKVVIGAPASPGVIAGPGAVCVGIQAYTYTVPGSTGATAYVWNSPANSTILTGQNTSSVSILFTASTSGNVTVYAQNACGVSSSSSIAVSTVCRQAQISQGSLIDASIYPNPTFGTTTLKFETIVAGDYIVSLIDITGQVIQTSTITAVVGQNMHEFDLSTFAKGLYMVRLEREGEAMQMLRVTVE